MCPVLWDTGSGYSRLQYRMSNDVDKSLFEELSLQQKTVRFTVRLRQKNHIHGQEILEGQAGMQ